MAKKKESKVQMDTCDPNLKQTLVPGKCLKVLSSFEWFLFKEKSLNQKKDVESSREINTQRKIEYKSLILLRDFH